MQTRSSITAKHVLALVQHQGYRCAISGRELTPETASLDHIVPIARGGKHCIENVWVVHMQVNTAKGTLTMEEFLAVCRDVVNHQAQVETDQKLNPARETPPTCAGGGEAS